MVGHVLKIKTVIPPLDPHLVPRQSILDRLSSTFLDQNHFLRQLTLLSAPAGYGKTSLVRAWLENQQADLAWLSLDEADNAYPRFWIYLLAALQTADRHIGEYALQMLQSGKADLEEEQGAPDFLISLLNDLSEREKPLILVLDDYHLIHNSVLHNQMVFLIENLPTSLHLIITTRSDPPWPLFRWRARNTLLDIRLGDLAFSEAETQRLLAGAENVKLNDKQIRILHEKTEGWVAGLKLAVNALLSASSPERYIEQFTGSNRPVLQFLIEEVIGRQPESVQCFLLQTSLLTRLCAPLCDTVTGRKDSSEQLARLERINLFVIPLDDQGEWYRYHQLFADVLAVRLRQEQPEQVSEIYRQASHWFLENGEPGEASRLALAGHQVEVAAKIFHDYYEQIIQSDGPALLHSINRQLPLELKKQFPRLMVFMALYYLIHQGRDEAETYLTLAEQLSYPDEAAQKEYRGILSAVKSYYHIFTSEYDQALRYAAAASGLLPKASYYWRMNTSIYLGDAQLFSGHPKEAYSHYLDAQAVSSKTNSAALKVNTGFKTATSLYQIGRLAEAEKMTLSLLTMARQTGISSISRTGLVWTLYGEILREKGLLAEAEPCIERGVIYSEPEKPCLGWNYLFEAALYFSRQAFADALESLAAIELLHREFVLPSFITVPAAIWQARIHLATGDIARAREKLTETGISSSVPCKPGTEAGYLVWAACQLTESEADRASLAKDLEELAQRALQSGLQAVLIETRLLQTRLAERLGQKSAAEKWLDDALESGIQAGYRQIYLDCRQGLETVYQRIYSDLIRKTKTPDTAAAADQKLSLIRRILPDSLTQKTEQESAAAAEKVQPLGRQPADELVEQLSEREREVLDLISQGLSNQDISDQLFLTVGTVKWHTSNIYGKLGVRGRTQAVAHARQIGLIN